MEKHHVHAAGNAMAWKLAQMGGVKIIYLIRLLVLAVLLTPADFGLVAIATAATGFLMSLTNFGLIPAVVQAANMDEVKYDSAWTFDVTRSLIVAGLTITFASMIANIFAEPRAIPIIQVLALRPLLESMASIKVAALNRDLSFRPLAYLRIVEAIFNTIISIVLAKFIGVWALVLGSTGGAISMVITSYIVAPHRPRVSFNFREIRPLINFGGWVFLTSLIAMAGNYGLRIAISRQLGAEGLGLYFIAMQLAYLPSEVASEAVGAVAFPLFARLQGNISQATRAFRALFSGLAAVIFPVCALLIVLAPKLTHDVLGPSWAGTEEVIRVLSLVVMMGIFGEVAVSVFKGFGQPYRIALLEAFQSSITISFVWVLTRRFGLVGSAMAWLPAILVSQLLSIRFLHNILDHPLRGLQNSLVAVLAATGLCFIVAMTANFAIPGVVGLFTAAALGGASTILLLWAADRRYKLGFADNFAMAFPQFASFLRLAPPKPD
ncbi:MAG TPA: lipopolysaccharide biosynthesis protein [Anaerolineales bacterium]|nr:lipopolysaccharide biosynthesis protein [Anaerolineales bacterium]